MFRFRVQNPFRSESAAKRVTQFSLLATILICAQISWSLHGIAADAWRNEAERIAGTQAHALRAHIRIAVAALVQAESLLERELRKEHWDKVRFPERDAFRSIPDWSEALTMPAQLYLLAPDGHVIASAGDSRASVESEALNNLPIRPIYSTSANSASVQFGFVQNRHGLGYVAIWKPIWMPQYEGTGRLLLVFPSAGLTRVVAEDFADSHTLAEVSLASTDGEKWTLFKDPALSSKGGRRTTLVVPVEDYPLWLKFDSALDVQSLFPKQGPMSLALIAGLGVLLMLLLNLTVTAHLRQSREAHEQAKAALKQAARAHRVQSEALEAVSEEIRRPLEGIVDMSRQVVVNKNRLDADSLSRAILISSMNLRHGLDDLLRYSKPDGVEVGRTPVNVGQMTAQVVDSFSALAMSRGVPISTANGPLPATVLCNPIALRKAISSLVTLALQAAKGCTVSAGVLAQADETASTVALRFEVRITGSVFDLSSLPEHAIAVAMVQALNTELRSETTPEGQLTYWIDLRYPGMQPEAIEKSSSTAASEA